MTHLTHRGWTISPCEWLPRWIAIGPNYDASTDGPEGDWIDNGEKVEGRTYEDVVLEIDCFEMDREEA